MLTGDSDSGSGSDEVDTATHDTARQAPDFPPPAIPPPPASDPTLTSVPYGGLNDDETELSRGNAKKRLLGDNEKKPHRILECLMYCAPRNTTEFASVMWAIGGYAGSAFAHISGVESVAGATALVLATPFTFAIVGGTAYYCLHGHKPQVRDIRANPTRLAYPGMAMGGTLFGIPVAIPTISSVVAHHTTHAVASAALFAAHGLGDIAGGLAGWIGGSLRAGERPSCGPCCGGGAA